MSDYIIIEMEEHEDPEVKELRNCFRLLTITGANNSPSELENRAHSTSETDFEVIQNDEQVIEEHPVQDQREAFEGIKEESFEKINFENQEIIVSGSGPVEDVETTSSQQNEVLESLVTEMAQRNISSDNSFKRKGNEPTKKSRENVVDENQSLEEKSRILNKGLKNLGNTCYINALLQCLYHVKGFREYIIQVGEHEGLPLLGKLSKFFVAMKNGNDWETEEAHRELLKKIREIRCEIMENMKGDSTMLFQAITEELSFQQEDFRHLPQLEMFAGGELIKIKTCSYCKGIKRTSQLIKVLDVRDINFLQTNQTNYFQSASETQFCPNSRKNEKHSCEYMTNHGLPEILVIRIQDTVNCDKRVEILPELFLKQIHHQDCSGGAKKVVHYEFLAGVMNIEKGERGVHSLEISRHGDLYFEFNDFYVKKTSHLEGITYHPKLLFYKKV